MLGQLRRQGLGRWCFGQLTSNGGELDGGDSDGEGSSRASGDVSEEAVAEMVVVVAMEDVSGSPRELVMVDAVRKSFRAVVAAKTTSWAA